MAEYIDRQEALWAMGAAFGDMAEAADNVRDLPAADVQPVARGKWVSVTFRDVGCSECGFIMDIMETNMHILNHANFCPNCGADLREGEENV